MLMNEEKGDKEVCNLQYEGNGWLSLFGEGLVGLLES